jgi:hypothetical protein
METRPEDPMHGDFAPGGETLPCDERLPRSQTPNRPSPTTSAQARFAEGLGDQAARRVPGDRRHGRRRRARASMSRYGRPISTDTR